MWPWPPPAGSFSSSGISTTALSVVSTSAAIEAAFCRADRVTLAGSMTPALVRSPHSPVAALKPVAPDSLRMRSTTTAPS